MKIHEYQARELLAKAGIPVPPAVVADTPDGAAAAYKQIGTPLQVVKAQVLAGGRGDQGLQLRARARQGHQPAGGQRLRQARPLRR